MPIKNFNQVLNSLIEKARATLPEADFSSGSVIRELLEAYAQEAATLYGETSRIQSLQSIKTSTGSNLDNLAANYSKQRKRAQYATCVVLFTRANLTPSDSVVIRAGTVVSTLSTSLVTGAPVQFKTTADVLMDGAQREILKATGNQYRSFLDSYGIADQYALSVPVIATVAGKAGNVARGTIRRHNLSNMGNVINIVAGSGGSDAETDDEFRRRLLLVFAGSNLATEFGLRSFLLDKNQVQDVAIIGPGNVLMVRDGTKVESGIIQVPGAGGMIDVYLSGQRLERNTESYIFVDKSPGNVVTTPDNDYVIGVATYTDPLTGTPLELDYRNRKVLLDNPTIELKQPIDSIVSVTGSQSGTFIADVNYTLLHDVDSSDATVYSNSGFGKDRLRWLSSTISVTNEELKRSQSVMQDFTKYTDITSIDDVYYSLKINQEPAIVTDQTDIISNIDQDRAFDPTQVVRLITKHSPITNIISAENFLTGEKYKIEFFSVDGSVYISGRSLPSKNDTVLVSYEWKKFFDPLFDYDLVENALMWTSRNTSVMDVSKANAPGTNNTFWPNASGLVYPTDYVSPIPDIQSPTELIITAKCRGLNNRAVYVQGTTVTTVLNQTQRLSKDAELDYTSTYVEFYIVPPSDSRTGAVVGGLYNCSMPAAPGDPPECAAGGTYDRDVITSYRVLAKKGDYVGRVYPSNNYLNLDGSLTVPQSSTSSPSAQVIYENITAGEAAKAVEYVIDPSDSTYIGVKVSDIGIIPKAGDTISLSFIWEVRHPISQGAILEKYPDGSDRYILGTEEGTDDSVVRNVNNPAYRNPNTGISNLGNYDKIAYVGSINASNNRQVSYKRFATIDRVTLSDVQAPDDPSYTNIKIQRFQAPLDNSVYGLNYTYKAPKEGERITISYLYNKLINDVTKDVESQRLINTDILVKAGIEVPLVVGLSAVLADGVNPVSAQSSITTRISELLNSNALGGSLEPSFVVSELFRAIPGLVSVNFTRFTRKSDPSGVKSITFNDNEYYSIEPVNITVVVASGSEGVYTNYFTQGKTNPSFRPTGQASTCPAEQLIVADPKSCAPR